MEMKKEEEEGFIYYIRLRYIFYIYKATKVFKTRDKNLHNVIVNKIMKAHEARFAKIKDHIVYSNNFYLFIYLFFLLLLFTVVKKKKKRYNKSSWPESE